MGELRSPRSPHLPNVSGNFETVIGELVVDTELRNIRSFVATFVASNFAADQESKISWYTLPNMQPGKMIIRIEKGGVNDGMLGTNPVRVSWLALGD